MKEYTTAQILTALRGWESIWFDKLNPVDWYNFKFDLEDAQKKSKKKKKRLRQVKGLKV